jgi:hypothetical protein
MPTLVEVIERFYVSFAYLQFALSFIFVCLGSAELQPSNAHSGAMLAGLLFCR